MNGNTFGGHAFGQDNQKPSGENAFYEHTLKPFEDIEFFRNRFYGSSRALRKNPELKEIIVDAFSSNNLTSINNVTELLSISREIDTPNAQSPFSSIMESINLQREIIEISNKRPPSDQNDLFGAVALIERMYETIAVEIKDSQLDDYVQTTNFVQAQLALLIQNEPHVTNYGWISRRLTAFQHNLFERIDNIDFINELPGGDTLRVTPEEAIADNEYISALFGEARTLQNYGVKMSYKQEVFRPGSLVFLPPEHITGMYEEVDEINLSDQNDVYSQKIRQTFTETLAIVVDSSKKSFHKGIVLGFTKTPDGKDIPEIKTNIPARGSVEIRDDGSLYGGSTGDLALIAAKYGKYHSFRALQAEILASYIDLTNPLQITQDVMKKEAAQKPASGATTQNYSEGGIDIIRRLIIPRIKAKQDAHENINETASETHREVRLHGVVWHIRQLPEGWNASPDAVLLAQQAGITLAPGETFVRPHKRGSKRLGEVVAHELIRRE